VLAKIHPDFETKRKGESSPWLADPTNPARFVTSPIHCAKSSPIENNASHLGRMAIEYSCCEQDTTFEASAVGHDHNGINKSHDRRIELHVELQ